jgi:hypothetical protein
MVFAEIVGRAEAWVDGVKRAEKTDFAGAPLLVPFPAGDLLRLRLGAGSQGDHPQSLRRPRVTAPEPKSSAAEQGGAVVFAEIVGRAEAWVDGVKRAEKTDFAGAPLLVVDHTPSPGPSSRPGRA